MELGVVTGGLGARFGIGGWYYCWGLGFRTGGWNLELGQGFGSGVWDLERELGTPVAEI